MATRDEMVERQIRARGVHDARVLRAMRAVPRERFVPGEALALAYDDTPLAIGHGQTISQPYIVAYMTELLEVEPGHRVLEVGTGSGYQTAVLAELAREVFSIEIVGELARQATATLHALGYANVEVREGDAHRGWPERAPFDRILAAAAPERVPPALIDQLAIGGRLVIPVGGADTQWITVVDKSEGGATQRQTIAVRFVPFTGGSVD